MLEKELSSKGSKISQVLLAHIQTDDKEYFYKGKPYKILFQNTSFKYGSWIKCIIYFCLYPNPDGMIWVREEEEFYRLFKTEEQMRNNPYMHPVTNLK